MNVYSPRRWRSSPLLSTHLSSLYGRSQVPSGCGGNTLGPPILALSRPPAARATSRIISASMRMRGASALRAEILGGFDDAASEELLPEAIHRGARGEWIVFAH